MTKQPEALRLADYLTNRNRLDLTCNEEVIELRRLHEVNVVLLEALKEYADANNWQEDFKEIKRTWLEPNSDTRNAYEGASIARAALDKATGETE